MQSTEQLPAIVTPDQAADYLQVDRETVYRYIRAGKLDASRLGRSYRIPRSSIELLLLATRTRPHVTLREYTDEQITRFLEDDVLDGAALNVARRFDRVMGGGFFDDERGRDAPERS